MISLKKDFKRGVVSLKINLLDDLWYLSHIILPGDILTSRTERKIKIGDDSTGNVRIVRKTITLSLRVESVELSDGQTLRVKGIVAVDSDDVPKGLYHSFGLTVNDTFKLQKTTWPNYIQQQLNDAINNSSQSLLVIVFDREQAFFSKVCQSGIEHISNIKADVQKKQYASLASSSIYDLILFELKKFLPQQKPSSIVFASPSFWKSSMERVLDSEIKKLSVFVTTNVVDFSIVSSLLSRPELQSLLSKQRVSQEQKFIDLLLEKLSKEEVVYGFADIKNSSVSGAIDHLGITDSFIKKSQEDDSYHDVDLVIKAVDSANGRVHIIQSPNLSKVIDSLGGIAGTLRWKQH